MALRLGPNEGSDVDNLEALLLGFHQPGYLMEIGHIPTRRVFGVARSRHKYPVNSRPSRCESSADRYGDAYRDVSSR
jgi:hypothetical protein